MYCKKCGIKIEKNTGKCPECDTEYDKSVFGLYDEGKTDKEKDKEKRLSIFAYLGPLWIVSLICNKPKDKAVSFHVNQGLTLLLFLIVGMFVFKIKAVGLFLGAIILAFYFLLSYLGINNVLSGKEEALPVIGAFTFLKG